MITSLQFWFTFLNWYQKASFQGLPQSHHCAFLRLSMGLWPPGSYPWHCVLWAQVGHCREDSVQILISYLRETIEAMPRLPSWASFFVCFHELVLTARVSIIPMFDLLLLMLQYLHLPLKMREQAGKESSCAVCGSHSDLAPPKNCFIYCSSNNKINDLSMRENERRQK